jgi:signal transduction histidine kinase
MDDLIDAMLSLARIKRSALAPKHVDLAELAREIAGRLMQGEPDRQATLDIPSHLWVLGEPLLLRQLMENLIRNAWKFSGKCATTSIRISSTSTEPGRCTVSVEDKGAGFDVESADRLFKPFVRLHTPTEFEGTGIGLAIVQRIVTHHGGRIWATGRAGEGACFSFTLPAPDAGSSDV